MDDLIGTLPQQNDTGSPALAGQPPAITGANPAMPPTPNSSGAPPAGPALASAPPASGSADIGAPLSNAAPDQQAGAGAKLDPDLVRDRGTPEEYWAGSLKTLGSAKALDLMGSAANAASGKTGQQATMNPEETRRAGVEANAAFGIGNTREEQDNAVEGVVYGPMVKQVQEEMKTGVIGEDEGVTRIAQTMAQVQGPQTEDELSEIIVEARRRVTEQGGGKEEKRPPDVTVDEELTEIDVTTKQQLGEVKDGEMDALMAASDINKQTTQLNYERDRKKKSVSKDYDGDGKKDNVWGRMKNWWKKGKDDPSTSVDESIETYKDADGNWQTREVEVTSFMGGMTRQELGMFVFQWGSQMMANADKGFGGAMGAAGEGAMAGHQARSRADQANEQSTAQLKIENQMNQQKADAATVTAGAAETRAEAYAENAGAVRGGVGEWKYALYRSIGWSDEKIAQALEGIMTSEQIYDEVSTSFREEKAKVAREETMSLPDNMRAKTTLPDGTEVPTAKLTEDHIKLLATEAAKVQVEARGALNPKPVDDGSGALPPDPTDAFSAAMGTYGNNKP